MFSKQSFHTFIRSVPWQRIGYPVGAIGMFVILFACSFSSQSFFSSMIDRATALPSASVRQDARFHLDAYRAIAPFFNGLAPAVKRTDDPSRATVQLALRSDPVHRASMALLDQTLKRNGWTATTLSEATTAEITASLTTVRYKEARKTMAPSLMDALAQAGLVAVVGEPLPNDAPSDILITIGDY